MKKIFLAVAFITAAYSTALAQKEYRLAKNTGKLLINNLRNVEVEGYDGKEIVFTLVNSNESEEASISNKSRGNDPRAKGLTALSNNGFDNTGLGLNVSENGSDAIVTGIGNSQQDYHLFIKLPNSVGLTLVNTGWPFFMSDSADIVIKNLKSEVDISVQFENCKLANVSGPISVKTMNSNIEIIQNTPATNQIYAYTVNGFIDFQITENTKADISLSSIHGTVYADQTLKLVSVRPDNSSSDAETVARPKAVARAITADRIVTENGKVTAYGIKSGKSDSAKQEAKETIMKNLYSSITIPYGGSSSFSGTLNGGGAKVQLQTLSGNIYLRK